MTFSHEVMVVTNCRTSSIKAAIHALKHSQGPLSQVNVSNIRHVSHRKIRRPEDDDRKRPKLQQDR